MSDGDCTPGREPRSVAASLTGILSTVTQARPRHPNKEPSGINRAVFTGQTCYRSVTQPTASKHWTRLWYSHICAEKGR